MKTICMLIILTCFTLLTGRAQQSADAAGGSATPDKLMWPSPEPAAATPDIPTTASVSGKREEPPDTTDVDIMPTVVQRANPKYPKEALEKKLEGMVWVKILVDKGGKVKEAQVMKSTNDLFNNSALEAAKQFTFTPGTKKDKNVEVWVTVPFKYKLADKPVSKPEHEPGSTKKK